MAESISTDKGLVVRHSIVEIIEHWVIALSGLTLVLSGFFQMPTAHRYYISSIPGMAWASDFIVSLYVHYAASVLFIAAAFFHVVYHGMRGDFGLLPQKGDVGASIDVIKSFFGKGEEPPFHKYLPEQRLAYAGMAFTVAVLIVSGLVKTYKNIYAPDMSLTFVLVATWLHNIFFVLFVLAFFGHIAALILKPNRPLVRAIFTGAVRLDYAERRHPLWLEEIRQKQPPPEIDEPATPPVAEDTPDMRETETAAVAEKEQTKTDAGA